MVARSGGQPDGTVMLRAEGRAHRSEAEALGIRVADALLEQGAGEILAQIYANETPAS